MTHSALMAALLCGATAAATFAAEPLRYNRDVRPILSDNCFACHGPDKANQKGGLRLDQREAAITPLESGLAAIVPGKPNASSLMKRITSTDKDEVMPPPSSHKKLNAKQKEILRRWIAEGAEYEPHWAFNSVAPVKVPTAADLAQVDAALLKWPRNPIDWFVLRGLAKSGLKPSPRTDAATLARRIALDLTGLPSEYISRRMQALSADAANSAASGSAKGATELRLAPDFDDKQLNDFITAHFASPHYGERMAVDWLDAARFADTQGYQVDRDQDMHLFRDWVIAAFNKNLPFDQFTIEQLAGDLLPDATNEQKVATGFHRNHMVNQEGGIISAEFIAEYTADRVETTAAVWLGQTFTCCRCHDHKFDPFTQKDFYGLKAFFNNVGEQGDGGQDSLSLPSAEIEAKIAPLQAQLDSAQEQLKKLQISDADVRAWADRLVTQRLQWQPFEIKAVSGKQGAPKATSDATAVELNLVNRENSAIKVSIKLPVDKTITALRIECSTKAEGANITLGKTFPQQGKKPLAVSGAAEGLSLKAAQADDLLDGPNRKQNISLQPTPKQSAALVWQLDQPLTAKSEKETLDFNVTVTNAGRETEWRFFFTDAPVDQLVPQSTLDLAAKAAAALKPNEHAALKREYQLGLSEHKAASAKIADLNEKIAAIRKQQPTAFVMREQAKAKDTFVLMRGVYNKPGEKVTAATPAVLPMLPEGAPLNRLGLARWLVSREQPLTARVTVNRLWQSLFGVGLVRTSEDFGSQGELPSNPELLDWLAAEFMQNGWNIQYMLRLMLTSATYQQSSRVTRELLAADPENRLLARGPRFRLHGEFVRDQALAAAGLLSGKIGGKSVKPYHPPGLYELVTAGSTTNVYVEDKGEGLRRRSLYTYWKRSVPHPAMLAFDAPGREICALRRPRSNTPIQALNLMNDPTYVEAARHLALRMLKTSAGLTEQLQQGYRLLLGRDATAAELAVLSRAYERNRADFVANPSAAAGLLKAGESATTDAAIDPATLAAMTGIASTLLCLDETVTKE